MWRGGLALYISQVQSPAGPQASCSRIRASVSKQYKLVPVNDSKAGKVTTGLDQVTEPTAGFSITSPAGCLPWTMAIPYLTLPLELSRGSVLK